jgi:hypothetical protein
MLNNSFTAEMNVVGDDDLSSTAKRSLILFVFRKYTNASVSGSCYVLTETEQPLYNNCPIDPQPLLPNLKEDGDQSSDDAVLWPYTIAELIGRRYLVVGHWNASLDDKMTRDKIFLCVTLRDIYSA